MCRYAFVSICMYCVFMYIYREIGVCGYIYVYIYVCVYVYTHLYTYTCMYRYIYMSIYISIVYLGPFKFSTERGVFSSLARLVPTVEAGEHLDR